MTKILLFFCCLIGAAVTSLHSCEDGNGDISSSSSFESSSLQTNLFVGQREGRGIGYKRGYTTLGAQAAYVRDCGCFIPFLDIRGHRFDDNKYAANAGIGVRYSLESCARSILGANIYYDYRQYHSKNFNQVGIGLEWLSDCINVRVNGYIPIERSRRIRTTLCRYLGGFFLEKRKFAHALGGADAELEVLLLRCRKFEIYAAAGPYAFAQRTKRHHTRRAIGGQFRMEARLGTYFIVGGCVSRDSLFHTRGQGYITFDFPLGWGCFKDCCTTPDLLFVPVIRREIIPIHNQCKCRSNF